MKKIIFITVLITSYFISNAQVETVIPFSKTVTPIFKDKKRSTKLSFTTKDNDGGFFIGRKYRKGYYIDHYNSDLKLLKSYDFNLKMNKSMDKIITAFISGDNLCLIERFYNRNNKSIEFYAHTSSKEKFSFSKKKLLSILKKEIPKTSIFFGDYKIDGDQYGDIQFSEKEEFFTISFDIKGNKEEKQRFFTFDNALNKIYQTTFVRAIKDRKFKLQNINIDTKNGDVYLLGKAYTKQKKKKRKGGKYQYEIHKITKKRNTSIVINSGEKHIGSLQIKSNEDKKICVGFYSEKRDSQFKGVVVFKLNGDNTKIEKSNYVPFDNQFLIDKYGKEKQKELRNLVVRDVFFTKDNHIIINAEEFYIRVVHHKDMSPTYIYNYKDIVSVNINEDGKLIWARNINKKQVGGNSYFFSYISFFDNNTNYFIFNASKTLKKKRNNRYEFKASISGLQNIYIASIDGSKDIKYHKFYDRKDANVNFDIQNAVMSKDGKSVILQGKKGSKKRILKISF